MVWVQARTMKLADTAAGEVEAPRGGSAGKPPAAQTIKPAHLIDPIDAPTRVLNYLACDTQSIDWRANSSIGMVLQGLANWLRCVMSTRCAWEAI